MAIPLLDLSAIHSALDGDLHTAFARVLKSGHFIMGAEVEAFESEIAAAIGVKHAIAMSSGSDALLAALMAIDLGTGDEVITTTYSFFATAGCVARLGARPVFVDVDDDTLNINVDQVRAAVTPKTKAILPVHLFGLPADMDGLIELGRKHNLVVIEDACQAIGSTYKGQRVGTIGDMSTFSFFPSKNLGGFGDGGLAATGDDVLAKRLRMLRAHGSQKKYYHEIVGGNFRLDALQAALLRVKLPYLPEWTSARAEAATRYRRLFSEFDVKAVKLPVEQADRTHIFHQFVIRVDDRDKLRSYLTERGISTEVYYPVPLHLQQCFVPLGYRAGDLPVAERAALQALALPMFPGLSEAQQREVVAAIAEFRSAARKPSF